MRSGVGPCNDLDPMVLSICPQAMLVRIEACRALLAEQPCSAAASSVESELDDLERLVEVLDGDGVLETGTDEDETMTLCVQYAARLVELEHAAGAAARS